jgi:hypothetical protein
LTRHYRLYERRECGPIEPLYGVPGSILLTKPFAPSQLVTAISNLLNSTRHPNDVGRPALPSHPPIDEIPAPGAISKIWVRAALEPVAGPYRLRELAATVAASELVRKKNGGQKPRRVLVIVEVKIPAL